MMVVPFRVMVLLFSLTILTIPARLYKLPTGLPVDIEIYRLVAVSILFCWMISLLIDPKVHWRSTPFDRQIIWIILAVMLALYANLLDTGSTQELGSAIKAIFSLASALLVFYFVASTIDNRADIEAVFMLIVIVGGIIGAFGAIERLADYNFFHHLHEWIPGLSLNKEPGLLIRGGRRIAGPTVHPLALSALLAIISPLALYYWMSAKKRVESVVFGGAFALIVFGIMLTGSRTGFIGLMVATALMLYLVGSWRKTIVAALVGLFFVVHMLFPGSIGIIKKTLSPDYVRANEIGNSSGRIEDYAKIEAEVARRPLFGLGLGSFAPTKYFFVDNQYLKFAVELGLFGLTVFLLFFARILHFLWQAVRTAQSDLKPLLAAVMSSALVFIVTTATFDNLSFPQVLFLFFIILALGISLIRESGGAAGERVAC